MRRLRSRWKLSTGAGWSYSHDGAVAAIYNDGWDAYTIGCEKFGPGHFSLYQVGQRAIDFGIHSMPMWSGG